METVPGLCLHSSNSEKPWWHPAERDRAVVPPLLPPHLPQPPPEDEEVWKRRLMTFVSRDCRAQGDDGSEDQEILAGGDLGRGLSVSSLSSQSQVRAAVGRDIGLLTSHSASSKPKRTWYWWHKFLKKMPMWMWELIQPLPQLSTVPCCHWVTPSCLTL